MAKKHGTAVAPWKVFVGVGLAGVVLFPAAVCLQAPTAEEAAERRAQRDLQATEVEQARQADAERDARLEQLAWDALPQSQRETCEALTQAATDYGAADNDIKGALVRRKRGEALQAIDRSIGDWMGTVERLTTTSQANGVLVIRMPGRCSAFSFGTTNNELTNATLGGRALLTGKALEEAADLKVGQRVAITEGTLLSGREPDHREVQALTEAGSMSGAHLVATIQRLMPMKGAWVTPTSAGGVTYNRNTGVGVALQLAPEGDIVLTGIDGLAPEERQGVTLAFGDRWLPLRDGTMSSATVNDETRAALDRGEPITVTVNGKTSTLDTRGAADVLRMLEARE